LVGHKISMTGKLVQYGVEISQLVLDVISLQRRKSKSWLKRHGFDKNQKIVRYTEIAAFLFRARGPNPALITQFYPALLGVYQSSG
jgi:hypothetical protein